MSEQGAVPIIVITTNQEHLEAVNSTLRNAGHPVHCTWMSDVKELPDALIQINPELVLCFTDEVPGGLEMVMRLRDRTAPEIPVIAAGEQIDESAIAGAMILGAQDVVSLEHRNRLQAVITRELRAFRLERALDSTLASATEYKQQLQAFMEGSADAIAHIQEGIVVGVNPAWLELFGYPEDEDIMGQPLMDLFDLESHTALKGALVACVQNKWSGHPLKTTGVCSDGSTIRVEVDLQLTDQDGEPCVRVCIARRRGEEKEPEERLDDVLRLDPSTGLFHRRHYLDSLGRKLAKPAKGGVRALVHFEPDDFDEAKNAVGPLRSEDLMIQLAALFREHMQPPDLYGRLDSHTFSALLERGTDRDVEVWADHLTRKVTKQTFETAEKSVSLACTVGITMVDTDESDLDLLLLHAQQANREGRDQGGNQVFITEDRKETETRIQANDEIWVRHIKTALMENRFKLVQQPIASLAAGVKGMYDVLVRMVDEEDVEILPSEFLPAAERNNLMKNLDRWVIGASMSLCATRKPNCLFVRLSKDSATDKSLIGWLKAQLKATRIEASRICFQITEEVVTQQLKQSKGLIKQLQALGFSFAVEHFGLMTRDPVQILGHLPMDYLKIDGSLMQGLSENQSLQNQIRLFVDEAKRQKIKTIAERVEDANTIAVLWQLGVEYMQGYYVQEPEVVLSETEATGTHQRPRLKA